jgi:glycosyltransferase involved in cell wall biosynthesis
MNHKLKRGVFVFSYPILDDKGALYFADACYQQTIRICRQFLDEVSIVARRRKFQASLAQVPIDDVHVRLSLELPDFGVDGRNNFLNAIRLLFKPKIRESLRHLMQDADFIFVEAPSLEAYLASVVARQVERPLVMEMRGEVLLNRRYMEDRFGCKGIAYTWFFSRLFRAVRKQANAGLYINRSLLERYPVTGQHRQAISDVQLPDDIFNEVKRFATPASRFLFVGHLEKIKCVDIMLQALQRAKEELSSNWVFDIVGDGPEMRTLNRLAEKLGIKSHVCFRGRIPWGELLFRFYREADLLLMASTSEGSPRTLIEGMAFGLPVISTSVGLASELLDGRALVPIGNLTEYANKLLKIVNDIDLLNELSVQNRKYAEAFRLPLLQAKRRDFFEKAIKMGRY